MSERFVVTQETPISVFEVWHEILETRPEVTRITSKTYAPHPHGQPDDQTVHVLPRERVMWSDNSSQFFGQDNEVKAIGARVETRPAQFEPDTDYSGAYRFFCEGDFLEIRPEREKSFLFFDFESPPSSELLELTLKSLKDWQSDWYLFDSGGSYHLIIDKLIDLKSLPKYCGALIMDIAKNLSPEKSKLFGHIGKYLIENSEDSKKLDKWADDVLEKFGHVGEQTGKYQLTFPLDMRWIAHVMKGLVEGGFNEGYLRVSAKYDNSPILIARQKERKITLFEYERPTFQRRQLLLPGFKH